MSDAILIIVAIAVLVNFAWELTELFGEFDF
jgi:hypothetical protein